jgi:hypothetical protein
MMSDAASSVAPAGIWVQLLVGEEKQGQSFLIEPIPEDVDALKNAVTEECTLLLHHCDPVMLNVFAPGADPKTEDTLDLGDPVPGNTSSKSPLIVVAPKQQQQHGELHCWSRILVFKYCLNMEMLLFSLI